MPKLLLNERNEIVYISDTINTVKNGFSVGNNKVFNSNGLHIKEVTEIPENVVPKKYCYDDENGFYENINYKDITNIDTIRGEPNGIAELDENCKLKQMPNVADVGGSNENLLDNWYFADPIDQRSGYLVYEGTTLYTDASCTTVYGNVEGGPYQGYAISDICVRFTSNSTYYVKKVDCVRGYTGQVYTIDRWFLQQVTSANLLITDGFVTLKAINNDGFCQFFERAKFAEGDIITVSLFTAEGELLTAMHTVSADVSVMQFNEIWYMAFGIVDEKWTLWCPITYANSEQTINIKAIKIELGTQQTLAHQDSDGNWVLNDPPPDKNIELLKCCISTADSGDTYANKKIYHEGYKPTANDVGGSNENLLHNWYFADPIDQRQGYVVPKGTTYHKVDGFVNMGAIPETVKVDYIDESGSARFVYDGVDCFVPVNGGYVRGYTGNGYGIDRWLSHEVSNTTLIYDDHISISRQHAQIIDNYDKLVGRQITISALTNLGLFTATGVCTNDDGVLVIYTDGNGHDIIIYNNGSYHGFQVNNTNGGTLDLYGAKIEAGEYQTLAHQDADGNWVLNDPPPDKNMELLKCCMSTADSADTYANNNKAPAAINAINKAGDTMTGFLNIKTGSTTTQVIQSGKLAFLRNTTVINQKFCDIRIPDYDSGGDLQYFRQDNSNGVFNGYTILHTGNVTAGTTDITANTTALGNGCIYQVYE